MNEREKAIAAMKSLVAQDLQIENEDVDFPNGLHLGTTWKNGQDFQADYEANGEEGVVYWSTVSQEPYY